MSDIAMQGLGVVLVVIVVMTVIWVISNVVRAQQEMTQQQNRRGANRPANTPRTPDRQAQSDIDGFLAEIERLRRKNQADKSKSGDTTSESPPPPPAPRPRPQQPSAAPRPPQPRRPVGGDRPRPRPPQPERDRGRPAPTPPIVLEVMEEPTRAGPPPALRREAPAPVQMPAAAQATPLPSVAPPVASRVHVAGTQEKLPAALLLLKTLLTTKQGPAIAMILHEIFGPPKSRPE